MSSIDPPAQLCHVRFQVSVKEYIDGAAFFTQTTDDRVDFVRELKDGSREVLLSSNEGAPLFTGFYGCAPKYHISDTAWRRRVCLSLPGCDVNCLRYATEAPRYQA